MPNYFVTIGCYTGPHPEIGVSNAVTKQVLVQAGTENAACLIGEMLAKAEWPDLDIYGRFSYINTIGEVFVVSVSAEDASRMAYDPNYYSETYFVRATSTLEAAKKGEVIASIVYADNNRKGLRYKNRSCIARPASDIDRQSRIRFWKPFEGCENVQPQDS